MPAASSLLLRLTAAIAILAGCHLSALHLRSSCDLHSQERKGRAQEMVSANPAGALAGPPLQHARVWPPVRRRAGDVWVTALSPGVLYPSSFPPPPSPPPVFLALSGERCWESDTTGPIQRSLLQGEQTPAQEFGSHWTAAGGGETTLSPLFLLPLEEQVPPAPRCVTPPPGVWEGVAGWWPAHGSAQARVGGGGLGASCWWHSQVAAWGMGWGVRRGGDPSVHGD